MRYLDVCAGISASTVAWQPLGWEAAAYKLLGKVVVECDGHAFHERTKEQAANDRQRDRTMTLSGYKVMRFIGSEIHRRLMHCVADAHEAAWHFYEGPPNP